MPIRAPPPENRARHSDARLDWHPEFGDRGTVLAATGDDIDPEEIARLLTGCELTDAEMEAGFAGMSDPFGLAGPTGTRPDTDEAQPNETHPNDPKQRSNK